MATLLRPLFALGVILLWCAVPQCESHQLVSKAKVAEAIRILPSIRREAALFVNETLRREASHVKYMKHNGQRSRGSFHLVQTFLGATEQAKQMSYGAFMQLTAMKLLKQRLGLGKYAFEELVSQLPSFLHPNTYRVHPNDPKFYSKVGMCPYPAQVRCDHRASYRTYDGSCNNRNKPLWGASFEPLARLIGTDYADGIERPRAGKYGQKLPSARLVSWQIHSDVDRPASARTLMVMLMGQYLDHDLSRTAISKLSDDRTGFGAIEDVRCGNDGCRTGSGPFINCLPIKVPQRDPVFRRKRCLEFVRTLCVPASDCHFGPREQLNQITSFLDASNIYGSTKRQADTLRDLGNSRRGRLRMNKHPNNRRYKEMLPPWEEFSNSELCKGASSNVKCFLAGDGRVNEHMGLMSLHTSFAREHNRVEAELHGLNPHWGGERLYQETRRIVGAMWQYVVYNEWLPPVLGDDIMKFHGLQLQKHGYYDGYDATVRPDVSNAFATAAFRFGHSLIQDDMKMMSSNYRERETLKLSSTFRAPFHLYRSDRAMVDDVLRGFVGQKAQTVDRHVTVEVAGRLFSDRPPHGVGTDLIALNIQRAREHGLPGYVFWREWCGLGRVRKFSELSPIIPKEVADKLAKIYRYVEDIDLFPAGLSEKPKYGAITGPTFACIIANQFQRSRNGDKYWFENRKNPNKFTTAQLAEIRKSSLAKVLCANSDTINKIQRRALLRPFGEVYEEIRRSNKKSDDLSAVYKLYNGAWNERVSCSQIPGPNLSPWRDPQQRSHPGRGANDFNPQSAGSANRGRAQGRNPFDSSRPLPPFNGNGGFQG